RECGRLRGGNSSSLRQECESTRAVRATHKSVAGGCSCPCHTSDEKHDHVEKIGFGADCQPDPRLRMKFDFQNLSASGIAARVVSGAVSAAEVIEGCLQRISSV